MRSCDEHGDVDHEVIVVYHNRKGEAGCPVCAAAEAVAEILGIVGDQHEALAQANREIEQLSRMLDEK